jgi:preprotein translocase subunit SecD
LITVALALVAADALAAETVRLTAASARTVDDLAGEKAVEIILTEESAVALAQFTRVHVGQTLDVKVDGLSITKPVLREPLLGGMLRISGRFTSEEADRLMHRIVSGDAAFEISGPAE